MPASFSNKPPLIVLFNYGGGLRGLSPAHIMVEIERRTGLPMANMVDAFCGPSTGSILNAALNVPHPTKKGRPKFRARHMVRFYEREGINIFPQDKFRELRGLIHDFNNRTMKIGQLNRMFRHGHYNPAYLAKCLRDLYGDTRMSETMSSLVIPTYNIDGEQLRIVEEEGESEETPVHTMNNFVDEGGHAIWLKHIRFGRHLPTYKFPADASLFDAVMASTAAPTYFPCHHFKARLNETMPKHEYTGIDGSIFDNPCISYLGALRQHIEPDRQVIMICLGTGYTNKSVTKEEWNQFGSLGVVDPVNDLPLINILFHAPESALLESFTAEMRDNLFVFNKSLTSGPVEDYPGTQIDDGSPDNLKKMKDFAQMVIEENAEKFDLICNLLVQNRDSKTGDSSFIPAINTRPSLLQTLKNKIPFLR